MPLGIQQNNDFTQFTMDVWNDKIFYQEKEFPAGFMAILSFFGSIHPFAIMTMRRKCAGSISCLTRAHSPKYGRPIRSSGQR